MLDTARLGAIAFLVACVLHLAGEGVVTSALAQEQQAQEQSAPGVVVSESHIVRLKSALKLTAAQETHWRTLEAVLRDVIRRPHADEGGGLVQRVRARVNGYVLNAAAARRIATAAQPLIASLDDQQKQDGMNAIRELGVASLF